MARLRFPGRPGYRFDRLGVRYGADEARNVNDPSLAIVAYIHYGLRQFRELFGESDEEEEFDGFSHRDVRNGEKYLERVTNDLIKSMLNSEDDSEPSSIGTSTRFSSAKAKLDSLPTSDRTRGRIKKVMRTSYKSLIKEGLVKASKSQISSSVKEIQRMKSGKEDDKHKKIVKNKRLLIGQRKENIVKIKKSAIKVKLKLSTSPRPRGRPPRDKKTENEAEEPRKPGRPKKIVSPEKPRKKLPVKVVCVPKSKRTDKKLAKQLLEKAKKGRNVLQGRGQKPIVVKSDRVVSTPKPKKEFVLPTVSSRSSRVIIPNKRFIEEDVYYNKTLKKPKLDKSPEVLSPNLKVKDGGSAKKSNDSQVLKMNKIPEPVVKGPRKKKNGDFASSGAISPVLHQKGGNSVSLFSSVIADQAGPKSKKSLIVEGKRQRKPSLKMRMKKGQLPSKVVMQNFLLDVDESSSASHESSQGSSENSSKSVDLFPKSVGAATGVSVFSRSGPMSLPGIRHRSDGKGQDSLAAKRSGDNILRKAKLQLNRVAVNRSKAALARSLKAQMKKEAKLQQKQQKSKFSPQSPTSPLALSPISGSRGFVDMPVSPPPRPLFDNNNLPSPGEQDKPIKEKKTPIKRGTHISPKVMSSLAAKLASPAKLKTHIEGIAEEEGGEPPPEGTDSKGPRIKHVCRRAAMVLRKPVAKFPSPPSLRLSALPNQEKEKILLEESKAHGEESSDDERTMEEIIRNASTQEATVIKRSPVKSAKAPTPAFPFSKTGRRRKVRCRECKGCLSEDCGICVYCLGSYHCGEFFRDKPKFGGRSVMKQACIERKCSNPKYAKVTSTFVLRNIKSKDNDPDDDNTQRDGDSRQNISSHSSYTSNGSNRRLPMVQDGENRTSGASNTPPMSNAASLDGEKRIHFLAQARKLARTKEKAVTGPKPTTSLIKPISAAAHRGIIPTIESHRIKADTKTSYCIDEAWQQGVALAMLAPACVRTVCFLCGSAGKHELIYCMVCCEPFHSFCLEEDERPVDDQFENWCCRRCQFCNVCGHQNHLLRCDRCQCTYHPECLGPSYPTRPSKKNIWVCTKCVKCKSCGATTPGVGTNATWTYDFSLCYDCGRLMDKGNFCPICHKCYSDDDWDSKMIQCVSCESWVHARCEELTDEMYQLLSYLPEDVHYTCRICTSERPAPWERLLRAEFVASLKTVLFNLIGMKCSQHLIKRDDRRDRCSAEKRKSSPRGNRSPAKSTTPVSMVTDQSSNQLIDPVGDEDKGDTTQLSTNLHPSTEEVPFGTVPQQSDVGEVCDRTKVATDTERNIFKLIDECLLSDKISASLCTEPRLEDEQLRGSVKPSGSDTVSMETESYSKSESKESEGTSAGEMQVDATLHDEDQELLLYLKSCGESPEKEINPDLDSGEAISNKTEIQDSAISNQDTNLRTLSQSNIEKMDTLESQSKDQSDLNDSKNTSSSGETTLTAPSPRETTVFDESSTNMLGTSTPDSSLSLAVQLDGRDIMKASDFSTFSGNTTMQQVNNETPTKSAGNITTGTPDSDLSTGKKKKLNRQFPPDFESIREKLDAEKYLSVEEFSEDMVHIIQTALSDPEEQTQMRKKSNNSVRSVFVKQMEKCFPWFNISTCKLWEHNKSLPESMLPGAVLPPSEDHTYAQWLEREEPHLSPQPSPFKRLQLGSVRKSFPLSSIDGDSETSSVVMSDYGGDDLRQCLLCSAYGDDAPDFAGRLLYVNHDDWVHVNCALWSAEVFEETDGTLQNVHIALGRGRQMRCDYCGKSGATVGCCNRGCSANYHFKCARAVMCVFQEDKKVYCRQHRAQVDRETVEEGGFHVLRRVCVDAQGRYNKKTWNKGVLPRVLNILIGSCTIESLGYLGPLSDIKGCLLPIDFMCTRVYWSTQDARRRCVYTCKIVEVSPSPISPEMRIRDMRIVHDTTHPDFIPLEKLNIEAQSVLHMLSPTSSSDVMIVSSTTASVSRTSGPHVTSLPNSNAVTSVQNAPQQSKFDLNLLSPNTLKYLGKSDLEKYMSKQPKPSKPVQNDDFGNLSKMIDRLNQAASKSVKRADSSEREFRAVSPPTMPRIKRSSSCDIPSARPQNTQNLTRPFSPVPVQAPRPASVAAMPIRIKVKLRSVSPIDQPISITVGPQSEVVSKDALMTRPDIVTIDEEGPESSNPALKMIQGDQQAKEVQEENVQDDSLLLSPEQQLAKVLESVPPEILESSDGQTVVIMTDNEDISEEEALMLAQAALQQGEEASKAPEQNQGPDVIDLSKEEMEVIEEQDPEHRRNTDKAEKDSAPPEMVREPEQNLITSTEGSRTTEVIDVPKDEAEETGQRTIEIIGDRKKEVTDTEGPATADAACKTDSMIKAETDTKVNEKENLQQTICDDVQSEENIKVNEDIKETDEDIKEPDGQESNIEVKNSKVEVKTYVEENKTTQQEGETETKEATKSEAMDTEEDRNPSTPEKEDTKHLGVQNVEKKNLSPTRFNSGTIDRSVVEQSQAREPVYKNGVLIGWRISLDENSTADESGKIVSPDGKKEGGSPRGRTRRKSSRQSLTLDDVKPEVSGKTSPCASGKFEDVPIGADVIKTEALEMDMTEQDDFKSNSQDKDEKPEEEIGTNKGKKGTAPLKTYPLRRTSQRLDHGTDSVGDSKKDPQDLPLHDKIAQKIKAESLAKSSPGVKGPFKCLTCKRLYRTKESFNTHVQNCDFEVSTSEEEEEEEQKRYPVRTRHKSLEAQGCVVKLTDISKDAKYKLADKDLSPPVKRGRGRPPKIKKIVPSRKEEDLSRSEDEAEKTPESNPPKRVLRGSSHESPILKSDSKHGRQSKRLLSPEDTSISDIVSQEQNEPPAKRSRGRPPVRKDSPEVVVKSNESVADTKTSSRLFVKLQKGRPKKNQPSDEALVSGEDILILKSSEVDEASRNQPSESTVIEEQNLSKGDNSAKGDNSSKGDQMSKGDNSAKGDNSSKGDPMSKGDNSAKGDNSSKGDPMSKGDNSAKGDNSSKPANTPQKIAEVEELNMSPEFRLCEVTGMMKNKSGKLKDIEDSIRDPKKTLKTVFNHDTTENTSADLISDFDSKDSSAQILHVTKANSATTSLRSVNVTTKSSDMVPLPNVSENLFSKEASIALKKDCEVVQKQIQRKFVQTSKVDPCSHYMDKEKSTNKVQYYVVYPPEDKNIVNKEMRAPKSDSKAAKHVESMAQEKNTSTKIATCKSKVETQMKPPPKTPRANILVKPSVPKPSTSSVASYSNPPVPTPVQSLPQPLMIPQIPTVDSRIIRPATVQQRNIFEALQSPQGVGLVGTAPLARVQSSVLESAVAQFNQSGMLPGSIHTSIHQPQVPQPLTINSNPLQQPSIIPNIIQQSTSTVITAAINSISQAQFQTTPVLQATQSGILQRTLPVSQPTILHSSPTIIQSNLLPAQAPAPANVLMSSNTQVLQQQAAQPNVLVSPNQQVLPTNLISQLGNLLPGQLTPQQATVVSRLNLQNHQQRGMEYMGSFLLDNKPPQNFVSMSQTSPVLTQSLTPQQTQQIMNLVSGSVLNKDLSSLASALNQNLVNSPGVQVQQLNQPQMSSLQAGLGLRSSEAQIKSDTILHSNLVRHLPDGCKTVVCNPSEAVTMLKKILPTSSASKTTVAFTSSASTTSQPKPVTSPNLRNMLSVGTNRFPSSSQTRESSMKPYQLTHRPGTTKGFSVLKKILKPAILHRKRNLTIAAIKRHLALSPEKNGIIQGQISGNIRNSLAIEGNSTESQCKDGGSSSSRSKSTESSPALSRTPSETDTSSSLEQLAVKFQKTGKKKIVVAKVGKKKKLGAEMAGKAGGPRKRKSPLHVRNIQEKYKGPANLSHPMIHHQKEVMSLPQPEMEEEVRETPMMPYYNVNNQKSGGRPKNESHLMFEITSDDGFKCTGESMEDAWRQVTERVQDARSAARMKALSYVGIDSTNMFGLNNSSVVYLIEQLYGARHCHKYNFSYFQHDIQHQEEEAPENPSGCVRCEPFTSRKPYDMFSFLMSLYRCKPSTDLGLKNVEMIHKSQRRATSMDLPMAMRFRKLQEHAKEAVGVYRSHIHGRGLFCKRNIDSGEMVIEYAGEVIRASLTDKREKYYESKGIGCYMFRIDDFEVVDATMHGSAARFINHSCEPNCYSRVINVDGKKHIVIFAMRPISKGEELTYDYKFPIEEVKIPCSCDSKKCRKYLN